MIFNSKDPLELYPEDLEDDPYGSDLVYPDRPRGTSFLINQISESDAQKINDSLANNYPDSD